MDWIERRSELFRLADLDAEELVRTFGKAAYGEARRRTREARNQTSARQDRPDGHWERVRIMISARLEQSRARASEDGKRAKGTGAKPPNRSGWRTRLRVGGRATRFFNIGRMA
jgi:hypothetical protein